MNLNKKAISKLGITIAVVIIIAILAIGGFVALETTTTSSTSTSPSTTTSSTSTSPSTTTSSTSTSPSYLPMTWELGQKLFYLDPAVTWETPDGAVVENLYEPLLWYNQSSGETIPWLASSYNVSSDGLNYTFTIRQGIEFCDGTPLNASAVQFSIDRAILMDYPNSLVYLYGSGHLAGAAEYIKTNKTQSDANTFLAAGGVTVLSTYVVRFHLTQPTPFFVAMLSQWYADPVSPSYVDAHGGVVPGQLNQWMLTHACGTGPYTLTSFDPSTAVAVLSKNPYYWGTPFNTGLAKTPQIVIKSGITPDTQLLDIKSGAVDGVELTPSLLPNIINVSTWLSSHRIVSIAPGVKLLGPVSIPQVNFFEWNLQTLGSDGQPLAFQPFSDVRVREAMSYAFNATSYINDAWYGFGIPFNGPIATQEPGSNASLPYYQFNLTMAKELLLQAGPSVGFSPSNPKTVTIYYNTGSSSDPKDSALQLASAVNSLNTGLTIQAQGLAGPTFFHDLNTRQLSGWVLGNGMSFPDGYDMLSWEGLITAGGAAYRAHYNNSEVNSLLTQISSISNQTERLILMSKASYLIDKDYVYLWIAEDLSYQIVGANVYANHNSAFLDLIGLPWLFYWSYKVG